MPDPSPTILPARLAKAKVPEVYKTIAPLYNLWGGLSEAQARQRCLEVAQIRDGERVLEVAAGTGLLFAQLLERNPSGWNEGVDMTPEMLAKAESRAAATGAKNYRLNTGDAYCLDFEDASFDLLFNNYMFDLLPADDFPLVLAEFSRVLKPGGRLVLANMTKGEHWYHNFWETLYRINPAWLGGCRGVRLVGPLQAAGFEAVHRQYLSQLGFPSEIVTGVKPRSP